MSGAGAAPTLSVVIPTVGRARLDVLTQVLAALAAEAASGEPLDVVVVVDGGPGDDLGLGALGLGLHLRVLGQRQQGPAVARNRGWRASAGEAVAFLDDDAVPTPGWLADVRAAFAADPTLAGLGGPVLPMRPHNVVSRTLTDQGHLAHSDGPDGARLITANAAFRRSALEAVGGFDERLSIAAGEDWDLCDRLGRAGFAVRTTHAAAVHHRHPTTVAGFLATARRYRAGMASLGRLADGDADEAPPSGGVVPSPGPGADPSDRGEPAVGGDVGRPAGAGALVGQLRGRVSRDVALVAEGVRRRRAGLPAAVDGEEGLGRRALARVTLPFARATTAAARTDGRLTNLERAGWAVLHAPDAPFAYRRARAAGAGAPMAVGESALELLWRAEFSRPGAAPTEP